MVSIDYNTIALHLICLFTVNCGPPMPPMNGTLISYLHTREGATVSFYCNKGFRPSSIVTSTCTNTTLWIPQPHEHGCVFVDGTYVGH